MKKAVITVALSALAFGLVACGNQSASQSSSKSSSSSKVAKKSSSHSSKKSSSSSVAVSTSSSASSSSSVATPSRQPSVAEQIALVLMAPGAGQHSSTASQLVASGEQETATPISTELVGDVPAGTSVYALSVEHNNLTPFVVIDGNQAYLFASQSPVPYSYLATGALKVDLDALWQQYFQSTDLAVLAGQVTIGPAPTTSDTDASQITSPLTSASEAEAYAEQEVPTDQGVNMTFGVMTSGDEETFTTTLSDDHYYWLRGKHEGSTVGQSGAGSYDGLDLLIDAEDGTITRDDDSQFQTIMNARMDN